MSSIKDLVEEYRRAVSLPWQVNLSPGERVWMLVYPPNDERRMRNRLKDLEVETGSAGHGWTEIDISDEFGRWVDGHEYADEFYAAPDQLTSGVLEDFTKELSDSVRSRLLAAEPSSVSALVGVGSLYPFLRASTLISAVESAIQGRLLVLFPGRHEPTTHTFRLLDARDGFNYRARVIPEPKD